MLNISSLFWFLIVLHCYVCNKQFSINKIMGLNNENHTSSVLCVVFIFISHKIY